MHSLVSRKLREQYIGPQDDNGLDRRARYAAVAQQILAIPPKAVGIVLAVTPDPEDKSILFQSRRFHE